MAYLGEDSLLHLFWESPLSHPPVLDDAVLPHYTHCTKGGEGLVMLPV